MDLPLQSLHTNKSIIASVFTQSELILIDTTPTIYRYSHHGMYEKHSTFKGFKSYLHRYSRSVSISKNALFALVCDFDYERILLFNLVKNSLISQIKYTNKPDFSLFSNNSNFFLLANATGRVTLYETNFLDVVIELQLSDAVEAATFSLDDSLIAFATLDKKIYIYNTATKTLQSTLQVHEIAEALLFSKDQSTLLMLSRSGNSYLIKHVLKQITLADPLLEWPSTIFTSNNQEVSLVGTRSNQLFIYSNNNGNKLGSMTLDYWGITSINSYEDLIFIGFCDGNGIIIELSQALEKALHAIETKDFSALSTLVYETPILFVCEQFCMEVEKEYKDIFLFHPLAYEEREGHNALSAYILSSSQKRHEIMQSLYSSDDLIPFMEFFNSGNMSSACSYAYTTPVLQHLREFNDIKSNCLKEVKTQMKLLEKNPMKFKEHIESLPIKCSECVQGIIPDPSLIQEAYKQLLSSASAKNFSSVMDIVKKYPILRQTNIYRRLMNNGEVLIDKTIIMIAAGKMPEAEKYASLLTRMKPFASTGNDFKRQIKAYESFLIACQNSDITKVFSLIEQHSALRTTDLFKEQIQSYQNTILSPALNFAKQGEVTKMLQLIKPYMGLEYFLQKHLELLKIALAREIILYAPYGQEEQLLQEYHACFGWNEYYQQACEVLECQADKLQKLDAISQECREITTFITGERVKREPIKKETTDE